MSKACQLIREPVFVALTRPQTFAGVTYTFFIVNAVVSMEAFLVTKSFWVVVLALVLHVVGAATCAREPRFFDLWALASRRAPRLPGFARWHCNSYGP